MSYTEAGAGAGLTGSLKPGGGFAQARAARPCGTLSPASGVLGHPITLPPQAEA